MKYRVLGIVSLIFVCGCGRHPDSGVSLSSDPAAQAMNDSVFVSKLGGRNLTQDYTQRFCASNSAGDVQSSKAFAGCDMLLVHGWLGEAAIRLTDFLDSLNCNQRTLDYLKDQRYAADELGLCSMTPPYRSESVCVCGEKVARLIASNPRPVILVTHSKGCLDTLEALLNLQRCGQLKNVAGWIAIQGPFYGAEEAATFLEHSNPIGKFRIKLLGAKLVGVRDMTPAVREEYMAQHHAEIETLLRTIPVLCFASWTTPNCPSESLSDGHVPPESAILPGSDYIAKSGINHSMTVLGRKNAPFDRVAFTKTLLTLVSERVQAAPQK